MTLTSFSVKMKKKGLYPFTNMRLFIAIPIPDNLSDDLKQAQSRFPALRKTTDFHLTLQFLGSGIPDTDPIEERLSSIIQQPFLIELDEVTPFINPENPDGVWITCKPNPSLMQLACKVRETMKPLGFTDTYEFLPHITLGRYNETPDRLPNPFKTDNFCFRVDQFELIESLAKKNGTRYRTIKAFKL
jgi:2'-5' RNA ligase